MIFFWSDHNDGIFNIDHGFVSEKNKWKLTAVWYVSMGRKKKQQQQQYIFNDM